MHDADVNAMAKGVGSPVHLAISYHHVEMIKLLYAHNCDLELLDSVS
jgi:hypothetical protein